MLFFITSCSTNDMAIKTVADALTTGENNVFTQDNDDVLIGEALPFALKMYETLLEKMPNHEGLLLTTGSAYIMYANVYVETPAKMMPSIKYKEKEVELKRAKNLYNRGREMIFKALEIKYPGFNSNFYNNKIENSLKKMKKDDVPFLYWASAGWFSAYSIDPYDLGLGVKIKDAFKMMEKASDLDAKFNNGAIYDFFILYYGSMPAEMGGDKEKAKYHFDKAIEITEGNIASPYISYATTISIANQNLKEFEDLLNKAISIDPNIYIDTRLENTINQKKAKWYLEHKEDFFLID